MDWRCGPQEDGFPTNDALHSNYSSNGGAGDISAYDYTLAADPLDLARLDYLAFDALEKPLEYLTKPVKLQPWNGQTRDMAQLGSLSAAPAFSWFNMDSLTEPLATTQQYQPVLSHQDSETADSGYVTQSFADSADQYTFERTDLEACYALNSGITDSTGAQSLERGLLSQHRPGCSEPERHSTISSETRPRSSATSCQFCSRVVKNLSDARKHALTHEKPYRCHESHCTRKDGFATLNDLQRHRKSVHSLHPTVENPLGYICRACTPQDKKLPKFWPRRDNFKAHVRRKHSNWHENELLEISRSKRPGRPSNTHPPREFMANQCRQTWRGVDQNDSEFEPYQSNEVSPTITRDVAKSDDLRSPQFPSSQIPEDALMAIGIHTAEALRGLDRRWQ